MLSSSLRSRPASGCPGAAISAGPDAEAEAEFTVLRKPYQLADLCRSIAKATGEASRPSPGNIVRLQHAKRRSGRQHSSDDD
jgi:hypothetical protein